jgi:SAM-dependent methyltransferase
MAGSRQSRQSYYQRTGERPPRETLLSALDRGADAAPGARRAVDLGCGTGRDTVELLRRGWAVLAIDAEPEAIAGLRERPDLPPDARLETRVARFEETDWPASDLVNASFALPLCPPATFAGLWQRLVASLKPGGRFAGQLYGDRDSWAGQPGMTFLTRPQAEALLAPLEVELFREEESDGVTPAGDAKHWHIFHIVARKPQALSDVPEPTDRRAMDEPSADAPDPAPGPTPNLPMALSPAMAAAALDRAIIRYIGKRQDMIPGFVDRHFGLRGSLRLHRRAVGWDIVRAPTNVALAVPALGTAMLAGGLRKAGARRPADWLGRRHILLKTDVAREIEWLLHTEFLELPFAQRDRLFERDALAEEIVADPMIERALAQALVVLGRHANDPGFRERLTDALGTYTGSRIAASEISTSLLSLATGAVAWQQFTPGALSLGPLVAGSVAHMLAVSSFPLGSTAGALWYAMFPAAASPLFVAGVTGSVLAGAALLTAFAGVVADPVQRRLGLHRRRLVRLVDVLEQQLRGEDARMVVRDHYVARLLDLFDLLRVAYRLAGH